MNEELKDKLKIIKEEHKLKMIELEYIRETMQLSHKLQLERQRIKSAEIRRSQERREFSNMRR